MAERKRLAAAQEKAERLAIQKSLRRVSLDYDAGAALGDALLPLGAVLHHDLTEAVLHLVVARRLGDKALLAIRQLRQNLVHAENKFALLREGQFADLPPLLLHQDLLDRRRKARTSHRRRGCAARQRRDDSERGSAENCLEAHLCFNPPFGFVSPRAG